MILNAKAREDLEGKGFVLKNNIELEAEDTDRKNFFGDVYTCLIGREDLETGKLTSYLKIDRENGNTVELDKILNSSSTIIKTNNIVLNRTTLLENNVLSYYIPYDILESSKFRETVTEKYVIGCVNGRWQCEYELLVTCGGGKTRRIVVEQNTINVGMVDWISNDLEDEVRDAIQGEAGTVFEGIIETDHDGCYITTFDELGNAQEIEIENTSEFMNMIMSVRCIKCDFVEK